MPKTPWTHITLYFADGSGLTSKWDVQHGRARQQGGTVQMASAAATPVHLRALTEIRDAGASTNWFTNPELTSDDEIDIDWTDFTWREEDET